MGYRSLALAILTIIVVCSVLSMLYFNTGVETTTIVTVNKRQRPRKHKQSTSSDFEPLPQSVVDGVKTFIFFIGHAHSGHSIVGSILDSHPHILVADELDIFHKLDLPGFTTKPSLFNSIWKSSYESVRVKKGHRSHDLKGKGFNLGVKDLYQGTYNSYVDVIGDKRGDLTVSLMWKEEERWNKSYKNLNNMINIPMKVFHVIRNPYDNIASTILLYKHRRYHTTFLTIKKENKSYDFDDNLDGLITKYFNFYQTLEDAIKKYNLDVIRVHGKDLITNPRRVIKQMCEFLGVNCSEHYLSVCSTKVYDSESKMRYKVNWPKKYIRKVQSNIQKYDSLQRYYSFDS